MLKNISMNLLKIKNTKLFIYYLIGGISIVIGYLVFISSFYLTNNIIWSLLIQFLVSFFLRYISYKKFIFKKLNVLTYLLFYITFFTLNVYFLYSTKDMYNVYLLQLIYITFISSLIFIILKKYET